MSAWIRNFINADDRWVVRAPIFYAAIATLIVAIAAMAPL